MKLSLKYLKKLHEKGIRLNGEGSLVHLHIRPLGLMWIMNYMLDEEVSSKRLTASTMRALADFDKPDLRELIIKGVRLPAYEREYVIALAYLEGSPPRSLVRLPLLSSMVQEVEFQSFPFVTTPKGMESLIVIGFSDAEANTIGSGGLIRIRK